MPSAPRIKPNSVGYYRKAASLLMKDLSGDHWQRQLEAGQRFTLLTSFRHLPLDALARPRVVKRKHALAVVAMEAGYPSWTTLKRDLERSNDIDFTEFFGRFPGFLNVWFSSHTEARDHLQTAGGFLFPYRHQCFVSSHGFVEKLGLDPRDKDWELIGRDWVRPDNPAAYHRLAWKLSVLHGG